MKNDDHNFALIGKGEAEDFLGYNSSSDKTSLKPGFLIRGSKNVLKKLSGTIASRPGLKRRGEIDATEAGVKSSFEWETNVGTSRYLRVCDNKLQVESDIVETGTYEWYDLLLTSTLTNPAASLTRFVFDTWWDTDEQTDRLLMVRGDDKILHWSGGIAIVSAGSQAVTGGIQSTGFGVDVATGYVAGDIVDVVQSGASGGKLRILTVNGSGDPLTWEIYAVGQGYSTASSVATTGGSGSNFEFAISTVASFYTLTKQGTETWAELGFATNLESDKKLIINGVEYTYTGGEDSTTLSGITVDTSGIVSGQIAIQSVLVADEKPADNFKADFIKVIGNQAWVGSYSSRTIYVSSNTNSGSTLGFSDFTNSGSVIPGDPLSVILDSNAKGIGEKDGKVITFGGLSDLYVITPNQNTPVSFTNSDSVSQFIIHKVEKKTLPGLQASLGHEFIGNFGNDLIWLDQSNQLRGLGSFANISDVKPVHLSLGIQEELGEDDFTGGHLRVINDTVHITAPNNGRDWMYQIREKLSESGEIVSERLWQPPQIRGISRFAILNGVVHGYSNVNPQVYQVWDTLQWYDDDPNGQDIPYTAVARFAYRNHGNRQGKITFDKIYFEGYMPEGVELNCNVFKDYQGSKTTQSVNINSVGSVAKFFSNLSAVSFGESGLGDNPLGDGIVPEASEQDLVPKFRAIPGINSVDCFEYCLEVYSTEANSRWELLVLGPNAKLSKQKPISLIK